MKLTDEEIYGFAESMRGVHGHVDRLEFARAIEAAALAAPSCANLIAPNSRELAAQPSTPHNFVARSKEESDAILDGISARPPAAPLGYCRTRDIALLRQGPIAIFGAMPDLDGEYNVAVYAHPPAPDIQTKTALAVATNKLLMLQQAHQKLLDMVGDYVPKTSAQAAQNAKPAAGAKHSNYLSVVFRANGLTQDEVEAFTGHPAMTAASWSHLLHERDRAVEAAGEFTAAAATNALQDTRAAKEGG